jgi:segregation and condensation protein A
LDNFDGPFDLLLSLITKRQLDITDVSLGAVTQEFIAHLAVLETQESLDQASEFLVIAATLLDMKVVGLLPQGEFVDPEDVKVLEARDLLFARLLQYRAFKDISSWFAGKLDGESHRHPRNVPLDAHYRDHTPRLTWSTTPEDLQALALFVFAPRTLPDVSLDHLHAPLVSVREQAAHVLAAIRSGPTTFRALISGVAERGVIVARFLAVLELYRQGALSFQQLEPLGDVTLQLAREDFSEENLAALGAEWSDEEGDSQ